MFVISHYNCNTHNSLYRVAIGEELEERRKDETRAKRREKNFVSAKQTQQQYYTDTEKATRFKKICKYSHITLPYSIAI